MILGIGTDLCQISRMAELLLESNFLNRYFDPEEQTYIRSRGVFASASMAGHFAAKEAFVKALGSGFHGIRPEDVAVRHHDSGAPFYELKADAGKAAEILGVSRMFLSISHEGGFALAFCVLEES